MTNQERIEKLEAQSKELIENFQKNGAMITEIQNANVKLNEQFIAIQGKIELLKELDNDGRELAKDKDGVE